MKLRTVVFVVVVALVMGVGAGAAFGYLTSSGSGRGHGAVGTMQTVTVAAITGETPNTSLQPGSPGEVIVKVHNPNTVGVHLVGVTADGSITLAGGSGCTLANSGVTFTNQTGLAIAVNANSTALVRLPGAASMAASSANGCQGATFDIPVTITVQTP
jgi:hypothetical protein